ncbi:26650_t:CDS:2, partial [Gigaspora margarita]
MRIRVSEKLREINLKNMKYGWKRMGIEILECLVDNLNKELGIYKESKKFNELEKKQQIQMKELIEKNKDLFTKRSIQLGRIKKEMHRITLKEGTKLIKQRLLANIIKVKAHRYDRCIVDGKPFLFCLWCKKHPTADNIFIKGCSTFRKDYLKQYIKISDYIKAMKTFNQLANQMDLFTGFSIQANYNKLEIISKMRCVYLYAQKHLPIFAYPDIVNLININFKNQTELIYESEVQTLALPFFGTKKETLSSDFLESSNYAEYTNPVSENMVLYTIATAIEELVLKELKNLQLGVSQDNETPELSILQVVSTRWLSLSNAESNLHQIIFSIIDALQADAFLADILSIISALCKVFQSDYVALSDVHQELNKTINSITIEFIGYPDENIDPTLGTHLFLTTIQQMSTFGEEEIKYLAKYYGKDKLKIV